MYLGEFISGLSANGIWTTTSNRQRPAGPICRLFPVWILVAVLCAILLGTSAGCHVGPDYTPPVAPITHQWKNPREVETVLDTHLSGHWWSEFGDPALDRLIFQAVMANPGLQSASFRVLEARSRRGVVSGERFPTLNGSSSYDFKKVSGNSSPYSLTSQGSYDLLSLGFDASWELDLWGKLSRALEAADAELSVFQSDYNNVLLTLLGDVASTYIELRTFQQRIEVANQNLEVQKRTLRLAEARLKAGLTKPLDAAQAKSSLHSTQARLPQLEIGLQQAENRLCVLLGESPRRLEEILSPRDDWGATQLIPTAPVELQLGTPAELLRRRPDIQSAELKVAVESARIGVATAELYPQFRLTGAISIDATDITHLFTGQSLAHQLGPSFSWNVLNFGRIRNQIGAQKARFGQSVWNYQSAVLAAVEEVENALVACKQERLRLEELKLAVESGKEAVRLSQLYYETGIKGFQDFQPVLDSQRSLLALQDQLTNTLSNLALNRISLYKALGGGWETASEATPVFPESVPPHPEYLPSIDRELPQESIEKPAASPQTEQRAKPGLQFNLPAESPRPILNVPTTISPPENLRDDLPTAPAQAQQEKLPEPRSETPSRQLPFPPIVPDTKPKSNQPEIMDDPRPPIVIQAITRLPPLWRTR